MRSIRCLLGILLGLFYITSAFSQDLPQLKSDHFKEKVFRGFTLEDDASKSSIDFDALGSLGVNLVRTGITLQRCAQCRKYEIPQKSLNEVDRIVDFAGARGIYVILTLVPENPPSPPPPYWTNEDLQASIVEVWKYLAERYKNKPAMGGFDLINEPNPPGKLAEASQRFFDFSVKIIKAIRLIDPQRMVVYEPAPRGNVHYAFKSIERPLPYGNVLYSPHFYRPIEVTHQGIGGSPVGIHYPNNEWNKVKLSEFMQPVRDFSRKYQLPIYFGEFSCTRFAPDDSAYRWIRDTADLIETEGWSWTFHSFRGWYGWDHELPPGIEKPASPTAAASLRSMRTPVMSLLREYLNKSQPVGR